MRFMEVATQMMNLLRRWELDKIGKLPDILKGTPKYKSPDLNKPYHKGVDSAATKRANALLSVASR